jgi:hypothetical protein
LMGYHPKNFSTLSRLPIDYLTIISPKTSVPIRRCTEN